MGATLSAQQDNHCEQEVEPHSGHSAEPQHSTEEKENNGKILSKNGKTSNLTDETNSQSEERDLVDAGSAFVTLKDDVSDTSDSIQADICQTSTENIPKQTNNTDDITAKKENDTKDKLNDTDIGFKKIFRFGGFKLTLKKDKVEKIDADEINENKHDRNASGPSEGSSDIVNVDHVSTNEQIAEAIKDETTGSDTSAEHVETHAETAVDKISETTEHWEKELVVDVPQSPQPEEPMSPIKQSFLQGLLASLKKKGTHEEMSKHNEDELKCLDKVIEKETTKDETTCSCLDVSNGIFDDDKNIQLYKKEEIKPTAEGDVKSSLEDKVQASPFKRLFRKLSTRRQSETKPGDTNLLEPGENISENPQLCTTLDRSQQEQDTKVVETQAVDETTDTSHEEPRKKSDSTVSWENLICVRSAKTRTRKTSDSEDETKDKGEVPKRTTESPFESSTEGDHLTSSNEQSGSAAEEDSGSTWKSFKKLVTPKRKSRVEENGSVVQMQSDTETNQDESSCSLRKLILGRKNIKPDGQRENLSSDEGSKGTETDIEDDETPGVVPLSEYESTEPEVLNVTADEKIENLKEKKTQHTTEEEQPKQIRTFYNDKPLCFDAGPSSVPVPTEYLEELTEFLSKHQQLSDIPEEGIIEESVETPLSFVEWTTQEDTFPDDTIDMTADAVTAPEHISEQNEDETTEMVSAVSQLSESPKTSGNGTPISPVYDVRQSDIILQEVVESMSVIPNVLSITTKDEAPEALAVSVSQFIIESATTTETKVLVTHKKQEATSIYIGVVAQEIKSAEFSVPLPLVDKISEITHSVATELVSEYFAEEAETAGVAIDNVHEAEITQTNTMLHEVLLLDEQSTPLAETARESMQQMVMAESFQEEVSPVFQMVDNDLIELSNGTLEVTPVHAVVHDGTLLLEEKVALNMIRHESEGPLQPTSEELVREQLAQNSKTLFEVEREHIIPAVESSAVDVKQLTLVAVTTVAANAIESVSDREGRESESTFFREVPLDVAVTNNEEHAINKPEDTSKLILGFEKEHTETDMILAEDCKSKETAAAAAEIYMVTLNTTETGKETNNPPAISEQHRVHVEVSKDGTQGPTVDNSMSISQPSFSNVIANTQATVLAPGSREENASRIKLTERLSGDDELGKCFVNGQGHKETEKLESKPEITPEQEGVETITPLPKCQELYEEKNQTAEAVVKMLESRFTEPLKYEEETGVLSNIPEQPETTLCFTGIARIGSLEKFESQCVDARAVVSDTLSTEKQEDNKTAKPEVETEVIPENHEAIETVKTSLKTQLQHSTEQLQKEILSRKPEETSSNREAYKENNQITGTAEITEAISPVIYEEETETECNISDQLVETGQRFEDVDRAAINTMEQVTKILPKDQAGFQEGLEIEQSKYVNQAIKPSTYQVSLDIVSDHVVETIVGVEQNLVYPDMAEVEVEVVSEIAAIEKSLEMTAALRVQQNTTTMELEVESHIGTENKSESEILTQAEHELQTKTETVTESKEDIILASEAQEEAGLVSSLLTQLQVETPVVTSAVNSDNIQAHGLASVINKCESAMQSVNESHVSVEVTLQETPVEISGRQTETESSVVETAALLPILKKVSEKEDVSIHKPVIFKETESKLETNMLMEEISHTVPVPDVEIVEASACQSETVARKCVENNLEVQACLVSSVEEDTDLDSIVLTTRDSEAQLNTVNPVIKTLVKKTETDLPAMQNAAPGQLIPESEMFVLAQEVKEPNLETPNEFDANALKVTTEKENSVLAQGVTQQITKEVTPAVPELELASAKKDMGSSVFTMITEEPKIPSCLKLPTTSVTLVVQTLSMISEELQRPCVIPVVETLAVTSAVKKMEIPFTGTELKERLCGAQAADSIKVEQPPLTEIEVKITEIIHQVTQDVENSIANHREDSNNPQETSGGLAKVSIPVVTLVESLPGTNDHVWEDATDICDDEYSNTKANDGLQGTPMSHGDK